MCNYEYIMKTQKYFSLLTSDLRTLLGNVEKIVWNNLKLLKSLAIFSLPTNVHQISPKSITALFL